VTWAEVPTPENSQYVGWLAMEPRGIWTDSGVLYGYDGVVRLKLQSKLPWLRIRVASLGGQLAIAGGEHHRTPKSEEDDAPFEWASAALYDDAGQPLWSRRWTAKPTQTQSTVLQVAPAPGGGFLVAGMHDGCMTFGKPHGRFCADEELEAPRHCGEEGCDEPFRLQYDANGALTDARTFPGVGGAPTLGPGGETAIYGLFYGKFDLKPGKGGLPIIGGLPGHPASDSAIQGLLSFYDAAGKWKWGRAIVGDRMINVSGAAFANDGTLWATVEIEGIAAAPPSPILVLGGKKPRTLFDDATSCVALLRIDAAGALALRQRVCDPQRTGLFATSATVKASRTGGVFWIVPRKAHALMESAGLKPAQKVSVTNVDKADPSKGSVVIWHRRDHAVWALEGPSEATISDAYDPTDGRVCLLLQVSGKQTWETGGARITVGQAKKTTTEVGCFAVNVPAPPAN
jgi:hypothetical protein